MTAELQDSRSYQGSIAGKTSSRDMDRGIALALCGGRAIGRGPDGPTAPSGPLIITPSLSRLSEQTLLVEKLSKQKEEGERSILTLKTDIQRLVCGVGDWGALPWGHVCSAQGSLSTEIPAQWGPSGGR